MLGCDHYIVFYKAMTMNNWSLLCLDVNVCSGTARRLRNETNRKSIEGRGQRHLTFIIAELLRSERKISTVLC